jgi:hypothetical protein
LKNKCLRGSGIRGGFTPSLSRRFCDIYYVGIMKSTAAKGILLMFFGLFGRKSHASAETDFWKWFSANETQLFSLESDRDAVFNRLGAAMEKVHADLTFEFGPITEGKREFVISAGGIKAAFPAVEALYSSAPSLKRWKWVKFRPRREPINNIEFGGKTIQSKDVHFLLARDEPRVGIVLFFNGYSEAEKTLFGQIGYLFLDEALGEFAVEMRVGFIEFQTRDSKHFKNAFPLDELPAQFDEFWAMRTR